MLPLLRTGVIASMLVCLAGAAAAFVGAGPATESPRTPRPKI